MNKFLIRLQSPIERVFCAIRYITDDERKRFFMNNGDLGLVGGFLYGNIKPPISRIPEGVFFIYDDGRMGKAGSLLVV